MRSVVGGEEAPWPGAGRARAWDVHQGDVGVEKGSLSRSRRLSDEEGPESGPSSWLAVPALAVPSDAGYGQPGDAGIKSGPSAGAAKKVATNTVTPPVALRAVWVWP